MTRSFKRLPRRSVDLADLSPTTGLFEGDQDLDLVGDINIDFFNDDPKADKNTESAKSSAPAGNNDADEDVLSGDTALCRAKFDSGLGDKLFAQYRAEKNNYGGPYKVILLGALMIHVGAKIRDEDIQYLHDLVPTINCNEGYTLPLWDEGFRGPGKRQFLTALASYQPGVPRDLMAAR